MSKEILSDYKPEFHGTQASYHLPNDLTEQQRLNEQHEAWKDLMHGSIFHAPVKDPKNIADIGCGTGVVSRDLASKFPAAQIYGVDLSVMPEEHSKRPPNLEYIQGDVMQLMSKAGDARLSPGSLDYVFQRLLVCGMTDWPNYVKTAVGSVRSGGWVEIQEWDFQVTENGVNVTADEWPWQQEMVRLAPQTKGLDLRCSQKVAGWMRDAGLVDVQTVSYMATVGAWDVETHPETRTMADYLAKWWANLMYWVLIPSLMDTGDAQFVEDMRANMLKTMKVAQAEQRKAYEIIVCYGRKP